MKNEDFDKKWEKVLENRKNQENRWLKEQGKEPSELDLQRILKKLES